MNKKRSMGEMQGELSDCISIEHNMVKKGQRMCRAGECTTHWHTDGLGMDRMGGGESDAD